MSDTQTSTQPPAPVPTAPAPAAPPAASTQQPAGARPVVVNTIKHGSVIATPEGRDGSDVRTLRSSTPPVSRSFTEHQKQMLANLDAHGDVRGTGEATPAPAVEAKPGEPAQPGASAAAPAAPPAAPATAPPAPAAADVDLQARHDRVLEHNKRLVAQLEARRAAPEQAPDERTLALDGIERGLTIDSIGSIRKLVALNAGIKDPGAPEVDRLMAGIYAEWTARELKMEMDPARRAEIGTERNRLLIERDRRDREAASKAAEARAAAEGEVQRNAAIARDLGAHLESSKHAERYPLMMKHSQRFDGASPGELLWSAIRQGIKAGEFPANTPDETLINHYSKAIETHYQAHRDELAAAPTSTAPQAQANVPSTDNKAGATNEGARTITNANASVAPPAPPAATPPATSDKTKPNRKGVRNEERFRMERAEHYFGKD